jgi:hypothetical protein
MLAMIEGAQRSVHIAGWHATPDFELTRESIPKALGDTLRMTAERARHPRGRSAQCCRARPRTRPAVGRSPASRHPSDSG